MFHVVLHAPEIPNNTGNIGRTVAVTGGVLHLIHPLGFEIDEKAVRRAGLDYWERLDVREYPDFETYLHKANPQRLFLFTAKAGGTPWQTKMQTGDHLLFGGESQGVPESVLETVKTRFGPDALLKLPMLDGPRRPSLNLGSTVCAALYEGVRQNFDQFGMTLE